MGDNDNELIGRTGEFEFQKEKLGQAKATFSVEPGEVKEAPPAAIVTDPDYYPAPAKFKAELKRADGIFAAFLAATTQMIQDLRVGRPLVVDAVNPHLQAMVGSVIRHPDPMVWMTRLQVPESYLIGHSVRCAILTSVLARAMGLAKPQLHRVAWGALLCQVGKTKLPRQLREKPGPLTPTELSRVRTFVKLGVELLQQAPAVEPAVVEIVQYHHERFDGSGYPNGANGDHIPLLARFVGVADWYDAMTSAKPYASRILSSTQAIEALHRLRDLQFQGQIVEEFIKAIGLYPNGTLVELSSGEVALVMTQNRQNRTQPIVLMLLDPHKQKRSHHATLDLLEHNRAHPGQAITIKRALVPGEYELDGNQIMRATALKKSVWRKFMGGA